MNLELIGSIFGWSALLIVAAKALFTTSKLSVVVLLYVGSLALIGTGLDTLDNTLIEYSHIQAPVFYKVIPMTAITIAIQWYMVIHLTTLTKIPRNGCRLTVIATMFALMYSGAVFLEAGTGFYAHYGIILGITQIIAALEALHNGGRRRIIFGGSNHIGNSRSDSGFAWSSISNIIHKRT